MLSVFYRLPRLSILVIFIVVIGGLGALMTLGRQEDPTLVERYGVVFVSMPGADAERVEALLAEPLESALMELPELDDISITARPGALQANIAIKEDLTPLEVDNAWTLIRAQTNKASASFPVEAGEPEVTRRYIGAATIIVSLTWNGEGDPPLAVMRRQALDLQDRFQRLDGTELTETFGMPDEEIRVEIRPDDLAQTGLSMRQAASLIAAADSKVPAGRLRTDGALIGVEVDGAFDSISRIVDVPLVQMPDGSAIRVGDVATVRKGVTYPETQMAKTNGKRTIMVAAYISENRRVDQWAASAQDLVEDVSRGATGDLEVETVFDQSEYTSERLNGLAKNLLISAGIVFLVLFLTMGWRSALVVGTAIPLTVCLVLILFNVFGHPLHQMSVTGLVISLGLLIDNAIVVVDEFDQLRRKGADRQSAIQHSLGHLLAPLGASTLTTALAFAPIAFLPGSAGEFVGMIGLSVIYAVTASFVLSVTVIPAMAGWFDRKRSWETGAEKRPKRWWRDGVSVDFISDGYRATVHAVLKFPPLGILLGLLPAIAGIWAIAQLPQQFFPQTERDQFQVAMLLPQEADLADAEALAEQATAIMLDVEGIESVTWVLGETTPPVYYNMAFRTQGVEGYASGWVQLDSAKRTRQVVNELQVTMRDAFPSAQFLALPFEQGPPAAAPIELRLYGEDLSTLDRLGDEIRTLLADTPGITYSSASLKLGTPTLSLRADEVSAAMIGERLSGIAADINAELEGVPAGSILEDTEELPVRVIAPLLHRSSLSEMQSSAVGSLPETPLSALGDMALKAKTSGVTHHNGRRVNQILAFLDPYTLPAPSLAIFQEKLDASDFTLPPGYEIQIGGEAENSSEAVGALAALGVPLILVMAGAVMLVFNSFRMMLLVITTGFLSILMAFFGVWLFDLPFGFNAILGGLGLLGISINGSIVVLSLLQASEAARNDDVIAQREVVVDATRHIVATTLTTMGGFVPILLSGDAFWMPLAAGIAGGVAGSAILALYFSPAVFRLTTMRPIARLFGRGPKRHPMPAE